MEAIIKDIAIVIGMLLGLYNTFSKKSKNQSDQDKNQDLSITQLKAELTNMERRVSNLEDRADRNESKMYERIEELVASVHRLELMMARAIKEE